MSLLRFIILLLHLIPLSIIAQDTSYYKKYDESLIFSMFTSQRNYNLLLNQRNYSDPAINTLLNYQADANNVTGIELVYDKFGIAFGIKTTPANDIARKGRTRYSNFQFNFGGNKWRLETSYRNFKGFYENNTLNYIESFDSTKAFYQLPDLLNRSLKAKFFYFTKHDKFSYPSSYSCNYRQFKTKATWVFTGAINHSKLLADTSFIPDPLRWYYGRQGYLNGLRSLGYSMGGGFSLNLVLWKRIYYNLTVALSPELQFAGYTYYPSAKERYAQVNFNADVRSALGYNAKRFFVTLTSINEFQNFHFSKIDMQSKFISAYFTIGFRIGVKTPKFYQKFQETKLYSLF